jgi:hypothetical protein
VIISSAENRSTSASSIISTLPLIRAKRNENARKNAGLQARRNITPAATYNPLCGASPLRAFAP